MLITASNPKYPFKKFTYHAILDRDKTSLNSSSLKDKSLPVLNNLQHPDELAFDIVENVEVVLENFRTIITSLNDKYRRGISQKK